MRLARPHSGNLLEPVPRETLARLRVFTDLLARWNPRLNLIARSDNDRIWERHIEDSLQLASLLAQGTRSGIDLGSGAGFPGLVLTIATGVPFTLIESDLRKAAFLREAIRLTCAPAIVRAERIGSARAWAEPCPPADLVTARALAPLPQLLDWALPLLRPGAMCLFPKGRGFAAELAAAQRTWSMTTEVIPSASAPGSVILRLRDVGPREPGATRQ